jgi:hypothetical protein
MLASWDEVEAHIRAGYPVRVRREGRLTFETGTTLVEAKVAAIEGRERLFLGTVIAPEAEVSAAAALALNDRLRGGALVVYAGKLFLRYTFLVGRFDAPELDALLRFRATAPEELRPLVRA